MKRKWNRWVSVCLALSLFLCMLPVSSFAYAKQPEKDMRPMEQEQVLLPSKPADMPIAGEQQPEIKEEPVLLQKEPAPQKIGTPFRNFSEQKTLPGEYFGRDALAAKGAKYVQAYDRIEQGVCNRDTTIDISACALTQDELVMVMTLLIAEHPEHYDLSSTYSISCHSSSDHMLAVNVRYIEGMNDALFRRKAEELLSVTEGLTDETAIALALHDALVRHVEYDRTTGKPNVHNAYGAIVNGSAVCDGYSMAYAYLLRQKGIQSYRVSGLSRNENHAWNLVRLNGTYYYTDVTWDDPTMESEKENKPIFYAYFNLTTAFISEDHTILDPYSIYPLCTDANNMYPDYAKMDSYSVDAVADAFRSVNGEQVARIYYTGAQDPFDSWWNENVQEIFKKMPVSGQFTWITLGREHLITFIPKQAATATVSGSMNLFQSDGDLQFYLCPEQLSDEAIRNAWQTKTTESMGIRLVHADQNSVPSPDGKQKCFTFSIRDIPYGSYKLLIAKEGKFLPEIFALSLHSASVALEPFDMWLYGDMNHDGIVDTRDYLLLLAYNNYDEDFSSDTVRQKQSRLTCMDVNLDQLLDSNDILNCSSYNNYDVSSFDHLR